MKRKLLLFEILTAASTIASAQFCKPKIDTATGKVMPTGTSNTVLTWVHKVSGSKPIIVLQVACDVNADSAKYAGIKLTRLDSTSVVSGGRTFRAELWYLLNPPVGSDSVNVFFPSGSGTFLPEKSAEAISFTHVNQITPFGSPVKFDSSSKCLDSMLVRSDTSSLVLDFLTNDRWQYPLTPDASQTKIYSRQYANNTAVAGSWKAGADSVYMNWNWTFCTTTSVPSAYLAVPLKGDSCGTGGSSGAGIAELSGHPLHIFPNPASSVLHCEISSKENTGSCMEIADITGRCLLKEEIKAVSGNKLEVNVSSLSSGMYFIKIMDGNGEQSVSRFIKSN